MEQLQHEHIVQFEGAIETENHILLILEYVDSGSLASGGIASAVLVFVNVFNQPVLL